MLTRLDENPPEGNRAAVTPGGTSTRREELGDDRRHRRGRDAGHEEPKNAPDLADSSWLAWKSSQPAPTGAARE